MTILRNVTRLHTLYNAVHVTEKGWERGGGFNEGIKKSFVLPKDTNRPRNIHVNFCFLAVAFLYSQCLWGLKKVLPRKTNRPINIDVKSRPSCGVSIPAVCMESKQRKTLYWDTNCPRNIDIKKPPGDTISIIALPMEKKSFDLTKRHEKIKNFCSDPGFFLPTMFAKDLTGCFSHCCIEGGDHRAMLHLYYSWWWQVQTSRLS